MIYSLQFLRAVAAISVVYFHVAHHALVLPQFGAFGVDIFFVISGYIIASISQKRQNKFLLQRFLRVAPLYYIFTLIIFVSAAMAPQIFKSTEAELTSLIRSLLFIPFENSAGYIQPIYFIGWTLNYEMYFYLIAGVALLITPKERFIGTTSVLIIVTFMFGHSFEPSSLIFRFFTNSLMLEFLLGLFLFLLLSKVNANLNKSLLIGLATISFTFLICADYLIYTSAISFPDYPRFFLLGVPSFLFVASIIGLENYFERTKLMFATGNASYSLYLIHPLIIEASYLLFRYFNMDMIVLFIFIAIILSIYGGLLCHRLIELPLNSYLRRKFI